MERPRGNGQSKSTRRRGKGESVTTKGSGVKRQWNERWNKYMKGTYGKGITQQCILNIHPLKIYVYWLRLQ